VLDEPTNDLDLETLELLEAQLVEFPGTLLLVSHDRKFLDNVVTSTLVFEGDGRIEEYVGGYEDWARQAVGHCATEPGLVLAKQTAERPEKADQAPRRLTYKEAKELDAIPARIDALEQEQQNLNARVASADFYKEGAEAIKSTLARLAEIEGELLAAYERWDELEERREPQ
jgi:ATP-binding cassette subfamily F protein uup